MFNHQGQSFERVPSLLLKAILSPHLAIPLPLDFLNSQLLLPIALSHFFLVFNTSSNSLYAAALEYPKRPLLRYSIISRFEAIYLYHTQTSLP
jgi:hypothetical protein